MIGDLFVDMRIGLRVGDVRFTAQRNFANILIKTMAAFVVVPVSFISPHRIFVPFTGKDTLSANGFKTIADTANTGEQVDKAELIMRMVRRRRRKHFAQ